MASYTVTTTTQQEQALTWLLAQQQAADPAGAPVDKPALVTALMNDRLVGVRRQYLAATATVTDLKTTLDTADAPTIARVKTALGM